MEEPLQSLCPSLTPRQQVICLRFRSLISLFFPIVILTTVAQTLMGLYLLRQEAALGRDLIFLLACITSGTIICYTTFYHYTKKPSVGEKAGSLKMVTGVQIWSGTGEAGTGFGKTSCISPELAEPGQVQLSLTWVLPCLIRAEHF